MTKEELQQRTKKFAISIIRLVEEIPQSRSGHTIANQIVRSGTSVGANYRSACKAKSDKDFLNKLVIIEEEADETIYWLELLIEGGLVDSSRVLHLHTEAKELTAIFTASGKTVRERLTNTSKS